MNGATGDDSRNEADGAGKRSNRRDSLFLTAQLRFDGVDKTYDVRIRNLSEGGMMAEYPRIVGIGARVTVELRNIGECPGRVAWCAEGRIGIALDSPIDPKKARLPVGGGTTTPTYAKSLLGAPRR